ncbi:MAG TPA: hypothetical protein VF229_08935, partial [Burkholderiaceae bacterium]
PIRVGPIRVGPILVALTAVALVLGAATLLLSACGRSGGSASGAPTAAEQAELDRGVGLMGQFEFAAAHDAFAGLAASHPN